MAHADNSVVINVAVEKVFAVVADGEQNPKWREMVTDIKLVEGQPAQLGAVYKQGLKGPGGRRIDGDYKIVELVPNRTLAFQVVAGPAHPNGRFELEPVEGGTKLTFALDLQTKGLQKLMEPMIASTMRSEVATLDKLKSYLEQPNAGQQNS